MSESALPDEGGEGARPSETLGAGEAPPASRFRVTREQLASWGAVYGTEHRQIRRWLNIGHAKSDPPPLDTPSGMPAWWARHMRHRVPDKILAAARASPSGHVDPLQPAGALPAPIPLAPAESGDMEEGEEVVFARQLVADCAARLRTAMRVPPAAEPHELSAARDEVTYWSRQYKDAMETFRKHKADDREAQKARGLLISRAEVECDIFAALKMLAHMRATMSKRVLAELKAALPDLSEDLAGQISGAIDHVRAREEDLFRNLKALQSLEDVSFHLAA